MRSINCLYYHYYYYYYYYWTRFVFLSIWQAKLCDTLLYIALGL
jgi:hypothetical protein